MTQEFEIIKSNLEEYPFIKNFLGDIIDQRLCIEFYTHGMLTAHLLELTESSRADIEKLELVLQFGNSCCKEFKQIFQERMLPKDPKTVDWEIINILAEVKTFELLCHHSFRDIAKIKRAKNTKTVDFTAKRNGKNYAVEVTRLGLAQAHRKKPVLDKHSKPPFLYLTDSNDNIARIEEQILDEVIDKYDQIKRFCQRQGSEWKGVLVISNGRDYFVMGRFENNLFELMPKTVSKVLEQVWQSLKKSNELYDYLHHILITMGKDSRKAIIHPRL